MRVFVLSFLIASIMTVSRSRAGVIDPFTRTVFISPHAASSLNLRYSSKSTFFGYFGFGWCSALDLNIEVDPGIEVDTGVAVEPKKSLLYGCEPETGASLDPREDGRRIIKTADGYKWRTRQGQWAVFDRSGRLTKIGGIEIHWNRRVVTNTDLDTRSSVETPFEVSVLPGRRNYVVTHFGSDSFEYDPQGLLSRAGRLRLSYDRRRNLVRSSESEGEAEGYLYNPRSELIGVWRETPNEVGRLLLEEKQGARGESDESKRIEFKIEISKERGAEMRPARILYDRLKKEIEVEGDRDSALYLLKWLKPTLAAKDSKEEKSI